MLRQGYLSSFFTHSKIPLVLRKQAHAGGRYVPSRDFANNAPQVFTPHTRIWILGGHNPSDYPFPSSSYLSHFVIVIITWLLVDYHILFDKFKSACEGESFLFFGL